MSQRLDRCLGEFNLPPFYEVRAFQSLEHKCTIEHLSIVGSLIPYELRLVPRRPNDWAEWNEIAHPAFARRRIGVKQHGFPYQRGAIAVSNWEQIVHLWLMIFVWPRDGSGWQTVMVNVQFGDFIHIQLCILHRYFIIHSLNLFCIQKKLPFLSMRGKINLQTHLKLKMNCGNYSGNNDFGIVQLVGSGRHVFACDYGPCTTDSERYSSAAMFHIQIQQTTEPTV